MNTQSLNRSIGLAMSALQQARAYMHGATNQTIMFLKRAIRLLNKARVAMRQGNVAMGRYLASCAMSDVRFAIMSR